MHNFDFTVRHKSSGENINQAKRDAKNVLNNKGFDVLTEQTTGNTGMFDDKN